MGFAEKYKLLTDGEIYDDKLQIIPRVIISSDAFAVGEMLELIFSELKKANNKNK